MNNSLSITKILSGISKTLNIARQAIPLYKEVKPMIEKSSNFLTKFNVEKIIPKTKNNIVDNKTISNSQNSPIFFL